jgi:hypothetical protein
MFEAEFKQHLIRINTLELDLKHAENEKENLNYELTVLKKKHEEEKRVSYISYFLIIRVT